MTIQDTKKLEEKLDLLIDELKKAELGRKRDKVFSKIDSFYNILVALSTFVVGVIITQHQNFTGPISVGILFSMVGVVPSMLYSYYLGFKGMIKDSIEDRIRAWCLLLVSVLWYLMTPVFFVVNALVRNDALLYNSLAIVFAVLLLSVAMLSSYIFTKWVEARLTSLLNQKIDVWQQIWKNILFAPFIILVATFLISLVIVLI